MFLACSGLYLAYMYFNALCNGYLVNFILALYASYNHILYFHLCYYDIVSFIRSFCLAELGLIAVIPSKLAGEEKKLMRYALKLVE